MVHAGFEPATLAFLKTGCDVGIDVRNTTISTMLWTSELMHHLSVSFEV